MFAILSLYDQSAILKYFVRRTLQSKQGYLIGGWENPKHSDWLVCMLFKIVQMLSSTLLQAVSLETTHVCLFHTAKCPQIPKQLVRWLTFVLVVPSQSMIRYNFEDAGLDTPQNTYISLKTFLVQLSCGQIDFLGISLQIHHYHQT